MEWIGASKAGLFRRFQPMIVASVIKPGFLECPHSPLVNSRQTTMIRTVFFVAVLAIAAQMGHAFYDGDEGNTNLRMAGGETVNDITSYSYQVGIRPLRTQGGSTVSLPVCSGVIIAGQDAAGADTAWILTSASCVMSGTSYRIYAGTNRVQTNTAADYTELSSSLTVIHPDYLTSFSEADLALIPDTGLVLQSHIGGTNTTRKTVTTALLPKIDDADKSYLLSSVSMAGWGQPNDAFSGNSPLLRKLSSRVCGNLICTAAHIGKPISSHHICTNGLINKGPCTGDAGAPLIVSSNNGNRIIGLATLTPTSGCSKGKPGVFTRLGHYLSWISDVTNYQLD